jgi:hypothetical protein
MIDVGMRQNHDVDVERSKSQVPVALDALLAASLEKAAIEQDAGLFGMNDVPRARYLATDGSDELNLHEALVSFVLR